MASTTKIMTATIIIENCNLDETIEISKKAAGTGGSRLGLKTGDKITIRDLLYGLMMRSGNDAAVDRQPAHRGGTLLCPAIQNTRNRRYFGHNAKCREKPAAHSQKSFKAIYFFQFMIHQERSFYEHI